jgi:cytochrome b involved in lipid metabolism
MRRLYVIATLAFWLMVAGTWAGASAERVIVAAELARHATPQDCWMAIRGSVYDLTSYLPDHPSRPEIIEPWCGKEATQAYETKTKGRPHSSAADQLLPALRIGAFAPTAAK